MTSITQETPYNTPKQTLRKERELDQLDTTREIVMTMMMIIINDNIYGIYDDNNDGNDNDANYDANNEDVDDDDDDIDNIK